MKTAVYAAILAAGLCLSVRAQSPQYRPSGEGTERSTADRYNQDDPYGYDSVPGYRQGSGAIPRYSRSTRIVAGRITDTPGAFGRKFKVRLDDGRERSIEAPRNAAVRRYTRPISVHELRRGEAVRLRLERYLPEGTLVATRVDVFEGASRLDRRDTRDEAVGRQTSLLGSVRSIDSRAHILRLESGNRRLIVHTDDAEIRDSDGIIGLRDLQNGDTVVVEGLRDGDEVTAYTVTVR